MTVPWWPDFREVSYTFLNQLIREIFIEHFPYASLWWYKMLKQAPSTYWSYLEATQKAISQPCSSFPEQYR